MGAGDQELNLEQVGSEMTWIPREGVILIVCYVDIGKK